MYGKEKNLNLIFLKYCHFIFRDHGKETNGQYIISYLSVIHVTCVWTDINHVRVLGFSCKKRALVGFRVDQLRSKS